VKSINKAESHMTGNYKFTE